MIADVKDFVAAMKTRGVLRYSDPVAVAELVRKVNSQGARERAERKRRRQGCRIYAQPFKGRLPARSDPSYKQVYASLKREAKGASRNKRHPELSGLPTKEWHKLYMKKWRQTKKGTI